MLFRSDKAADKGCAATLRGVPLTPEQRRQRARLGAYAQQAAHDTRETTAQARQAFFSRFLQQVDPDGVLPEAERLRRAAAARKAYFVALSLRSARVRARAKSADID